MRPVIDIDAAAAPPRRAWRCARSRPPCSPRSTASLDGLEPIAPDPDLAYAGQLPVDAAPARCPSRALARAIEQYLVSTVDHGFNASTFTARVIASTGADVGAAVVGAIGALSGPLHGGAPSRALDLLDEIGTADRIDEVVSRHLDRRRGDHGLRPPRLPGRGSPLDHAARRGPPPGRRPGRRWPSRSRPG